MGIGCIFPVRTCGKRSTEQPFLFYSILTVATVKSSFSLNP